MWARSRLTVPAAAGGLLDANRPKTEGLEKLPATPVFYLDAAMLAPSQHAFVKARQRLRGSLFAGLTTGGTNADPAFAMRPPMLCPSHRLMSFIAEQKATAFPYLHDHGGAM